MCQQEKDETGHEVRDGSQSKSRDREAAMTAVDLVASFARAASAFFDCSSERTKGMIGQTEQWMECNEQEKRGRTRRRVKGEKGKDSPLLSVL